MSGCRLGRNVPLKSDNSLVATYKYDAAGNRVEKAVNGGATERYVLSRAEQTSNGIDCWHVIATFDGSDNWKQNFVYRDEIDGIVMLEQKDVLDFDTDGNTTEITRNFYHGNALGSVMAISDMTQATAVSYRYDPYGKVTITRGGQTQSSDPLGQHWGFTGRSLDEETGLWYYRARYYDPETGRFLQRDPLGYQDGPHPFEYCTSNPECRTDPSGHIGVPQPLIRVLSQAAEDAANEVLRADVNSYLGGGQLTEAEKESLLKKAFVKALARRMKELASSRSGIRGSQTGSRGVRPTIRVDPRLPIDRSSVAIGVSASSSDGTLKGGCGVEFPLDGGGPTVTGRIEWNPNKSTSITLTGSYETDSKKGKLGIRLVHKW